MNPLLLTLLAVAPADATAPPPQPRRHPPPEPPKGANTNTESSGGTYAAPPQRYIPGRMQPVYVSGMGESAQTRKSTCARSHKPRNKPRACPFCFTDIPARKP